MKLHRRTFQVFWDVHAWASIVSALLLYVMFFAAAFALFYPQLDDWAEPGPSRAEPRTPALQPLFEQLVREEHALGKDRVSFSLHDHAVAASIRGAGRHAKFRYSSVSGRLEPERSELGSFLYSLHYLGPIPCGVYLAGCASLALFLALVTGVLIHLKDLVRQWFQFRPQQAVRTWASDMHKVLGLFGLPFQLLYAWSGAVLCLGWVAVQPVFSSAVFGGNERAALAARGDERPPRLTGKRSGTLPNLDALLLQARKAVPQLEPSYLSLEHGGDEAATLTVYGKIPELSFGNAEVVLLASDGQLMHRSTPRTANSWQRFNAWLFGLHYAEFGGYGVKWLYALLSIATCAVIVTGNWVWLERRDRTRKQLGNRLLQRLTVGCCAGLPLAVSALFLANRALPLRQLERSRVEQTAFWTVFALALLWPLLARADRRVAARQLLAAGAGFSLSLALDLAQRSFAVASASQRGVDAALVLLGLSCGALGFSLLRAGLNAKQHARLPTVTGSAS